MSDPLSTIAKWDRFCDRWLPPAPVGQKQAIAESDDNPWLEKPLTLAQFVDSPEHMSGQQQLHLWTKQQEDLENYLGRSQEDALALFTQSPPTPYNTAALVYGKGSGKSLLTAVSACWFIHVLLCLKDPQKFLQLAPGEPIDILIVSYNLFQSRQVVFYKLRQRLLHWAWLRSRINQIHPEIGADRYLRPGAGWVGADTATLPNHIRISSLPASPASIEGRNVLAAILDEYGSFASDVKGATASGVI